MRDKILYRKPIIKDVQPRFMGLNIIFCKLIGAGDAGVIINSKIHQAYTTF